MVLHSVACSNMSNITNNNPFYIDVMLNLIFQSYMSLNAENGILQTYMFRNIAFYLILILKS